MKIRKIGLASAVLLVGSLLAACGSTDKAGDDEESRTLRLATHLPEGAANTVYTRTWADKVAEETNGRLEIEFFYGESLLPGTEVLRGVGDGRADLGWLTSNFTPGELPLSSVAEIPFVTSNSRAQSKALEHLYDTYEPFTEEWSSNGVHMLFVPLVSGAVIGSSEAIASASDLKGVKVRSTGRIAAALSSAGANPIDIPVTELYESLERGVVDAYSGITFEVAPALKLQEVAPHMTYSGIGNYTQNFVVINSSVWDSLDAADQEVLESTAREMADISLPMLREFEDEACAAVRAADGEINVFSDTDIAQLKDASFDEIFDAWRGQVEERGGDADEWWDVYTTALDEFEAESADQEPGIVRCAAEQQ